jgi:tRNA(adenine34) deaminase
MTLFGFCPRLRDRGLAPIFLLHPAYCLLPTAYCFLMLSQDEIWMLRAIEEARAAQHSGEVPVGAVIVKNGELIATGQNRNLRDNDPSAHAEIVALRAAGKALGNHRLEGCEMYVIVEPCAMCAGALVHARLKRLVFGTKDPKAGAVESVMQVLNHPKLNHHMEVTSGVLEEQCSQILRDFFRERRNRNHLR